MTRAAWALTVRRRSVDVQGTAHLEAELLDAGVKQLTVRLQVSADRAVRVLVEGEPGATLSGFEAWSKGL